MRMQRRAVAPVFAVSVVLLGLTACSDGVVTPTALDAGDADQPAAPTSTLSTAATATMRINATSPFELGFFGTAECFDFDTGSKLSVFGDFEAAPCEFAFVDTGGGKARVVHNKDKGVEVAVTSEFFDEVFLDDLAAITFSSSLLSVPFTTTTLFEASGGDVFKIGPVSATTTDVTFRWAPVTEAPFISVEVDIRPGSDPNSLPLDDSGRLPTAILTTGDFDAGDVDPATVTLGDLQDTETPVATKPNGTLFAALEDVDGDADLDLVLHFEVPALVGNSDLGASSERLVLTGETTAGEPIRGSDSVNPVGP